MWPYQTQSNDHIFFSVIRRGKMKQNYYHRICSNVRKKKFIWQSILGTPQWLQIDWCQIGGTRLPELLMQLSRVGGVGVGDCHSGTSAWIQLHDHCLILGNDKPPLESSFAGWGETAPGERFTKDLRHSKLAEYIISWSLKFKRSNHNKF